MNDLEIFKNEVFGEIRVVDVDGEPWFVLRDILNSMGSSTSVSSAKSTIEEGFGDGVVSNHPINDSLNREQNVVIINESALTYLIAQSRTATGKKLNMWIHKDILPSVRKNGAYMTHQTIENVLADPDFIIQLATQLKEERQAKLKAEATVAILTHVNKVYTATEVAKEIGMKSAIEMNKWLKEKNIQFLQNKTWVPYSKYANRGFFEIKQEVLDNGKVIYHRKITQLGREFILELKESDHNLKGDI